MYNSEYLGPFNIIIGPFNIIIGPFNIIIGPFNIIIGPFNKGLLNTKTINIRFCYNKCVKLLISY
jgi:hypothetical protein